MSVTRTEFGKTTDGRQAFLYTVTNRKGASISVTDFGAALVSVIVPDQDGNMVDVALGHPDVQGYELLGGCLGATIGRNGNRIKDARFMLNGKEIILAKNNNNNNLHSGPNGYHKRYWAFTDHTDNSLTFTMDSPDGDQGFPGTFTAHITYTLNEDNELKLHYTGMSDQDTIANMTNHSYFNLNGEGSGPVYDQLLCIDADGYVPTDEVSIPYGRVDSVEGTPFDFRKAKPIGQDLFADDEQLRFGKGYDHNMALNGYGNGLRDVIYAEGNLTGITMRVETDLPGVQFYSANMVNVPNAKNGHAYEKHAGFALETQFYPDAVNAEAFDTPILKAGQPYETTTIYAFGTVKDQI